MRRFVILQRAPLQALNRTQEWLRDPRSAYLRKARTDMPWEEVGVMRAMLAFRHTA